MPLRHPDPDLFAAAGAQDAASRAPLAERMRPRRLDEVIGQDHVLGPGTLLHEMVARKALRSLILWGPPGCGKTTIARLLADACDMEMVAVSAVLGGVKDIRQAIEQAQAYWNERRRGTVLFVDEIHRFNKAQQDALLPHVEQGTVTLIGATTENPSFEVIAPLLSRSRVVVLNALDAQALDTLLTQALSDAERGLAGHTLDDEARRALIRAADADARRLLGTLEVAADLAGHAAPITLAHIEQAVQSPWIGYDRDGEAHYNIASALIKSLRDSDADAALYWCMRMLEGGEDPMFIARRLVILAAEDIGTADPQALLVANNVKEAVQFVGMPEARIPLAMACTYLAAAPKSNASYAAMKAALADVREHGALPVPMVLRNAPTGLMKDLGYGRDYAYAHNDAEGAKNQAHRPEPLEGRVYFEPSEHGAEAGMAARIRRGRPTSDPRRPRDSD